MLGINHMIVDINSINEPQRCFRIGQYRFCNWVRRGINQALIKDDGGYLRFPAAHRKKKKIEDEEISLIKQKEKALVVEN